MNLSCPAYLPIPLLLIAVTSYQRQTHQIIPLVSSLFPHHTSLQPIQQPYISQNKVPTIFLTDLNSLPTFQLSNFNWFWLIQPWIQWVCLDLFILEPLLLACTLSWSYLTQEDREEKLWLVCVQMKPLNSWLWLNRHPFRMFFCIF